MSDEQKFKESPMLNDGEVTAWVLSKNTLISVNYLDQSIPLCVPEARALYEWLGKVLP